MASSDSMVLAFLAALAIFGLCALITLLTSLIVYLVKRQRQWSFGRAFMAVHGRLLMAYLLLMAIGMLWYGIAFGLDQRLYFKSVF